MEPHCFDSDFLDKMKRYFCSIREKPIDFQCRIKDHIKTIDFAYGLNKAFDDYPNTDTKVFCL